MQNFIQARKKKTRYNTDEVNMLLLLSWLATIAVLTAMLFILMWFFALLFDLFEYYEKDIKGFIQFIIRWFNWIRRKK